MSAIKLIKIIIVLIVILVIAHVLKKQSFFNSEPGKISSASIPTQSLDQAAPQNEVIQNESIKAQLHQLASRSKTPYIAGCMKTPSSCKCYDVKGKVVVVRTSLCLKNVRDASSNQHKIFDPQTK